MRGSRVASRLLQQAATSKASQGLQTAQTISRALLHSGFSTAAGPSSAAQAGSRHQWAVALAACLGAGLHLYSSSNNDGAQCRAANGSGEVASLDAGQPAGAATADTSLPKKKTRVVVLGTGWGAVSFLKNLDPKTFGPGGEYELVVVSPRSYFLYTPLLPSAAAGSVQERSIVEPVRNLLQGQGKFYQAACKSINAERRVLTCSFDKCQVCKAGEEAPCHADQDTFEVPYDVLVVGVGSVNNTFGIKGVADHCYFLKSIDDAHKLRIHISKVVEHAGLPHLTPEERRRHLNFVVVGGGPTGVELAAELHDLVTEDVSRLMPHLKGDVSITVVDTMDHLLGAFDRELSDYTTKHFLREGIKVQLGTMVRSVGNGELTVKREGREEQMPFGTCVWATGVAMHPLVRGLREQLPVELQNSRAGIMVDPFLRVKGSQGTIFAVGDCAVTHTEKALGNAAELFAEADANNDQRLSKEEICAMLKKVQKKYPQMGELGELLEGGLLEKAARGVWGGTSKKLDRYARHLERLDKGLSFPEFQDLLSDMDTLLRPLAPTAQVASQEGKYLAQLFSNYNLAPVPVEPAAPAVPVVPAPAEPKKGFWSRRSAPVAPPSEERREIYINTEVPLPEGAHAFKYRHFGTFAYVGLDQAVLDLPAEFPFRTLKGWMVGLTWRGFETWRQVSLRNRWMVQNDWVRTKLFGRNISEV